MEKLQTHWYEAISSALNLPCLKEVSHRRFVFDLPNFDFLRKPRRIYSFWSCAHPFFCGSLADLLRFRSVNSNLLGMCCRIASLQVEGWIV